MYARSVLTREERARVIVSVILRTGDGMREHAAPGDSVTRVYRALVSVFAYLRYVDADTFHAVIVGAGVVVIAHDLGMLTHTVRVIARINSARIKVIALFALLRGVLALSGHGITPIKCTILSVAAVLWHVRDDEIQDRVYVCPGFVSPHGSASVIRAEIMICSLGIHDGTLSRLRIAFEQREVSS